MFLRQPATGGVAFSLALLAATVGTVPSLRAEDRPLETLFFVGDADPELAVRVRGQVSDLSRVRLVAVDEPGPTASTLTAARDAVADRARIGVWLEEEDGEVTLWLADLEGEAMLARSIEVSGHSRTARLEAVALVLRSLLRALGMGGSLGVREPETAEAPESPGSAPSPPSPADDSAASEPDPPAALSQARPATPGDPKRSRGSLTPSVGWRSVLDGATTHGLHGVRLAIGRWVGPVALGVAATGGLPSEIRLPGVVAGVARHDLVGALTIGLGEATWSGRARARLGLALWHRWTREASADLAATDDRVTASLLVGADAGVVFSPAGFPLAFELMAGLDALAGAPEFTVTNTGGSNPSAGPWPVTPRLSFAIELQR